jgi:hypothetical protein
METYCKETDEEIVKRLEEKVKKEQLEEALACRSVVKKTRSIR